MDAKEKNRLRRTVTAETQTTLLPFLLQEVRGKSRNAVKNLLTHRQVLVDGKVSTRHDTPLHPGSEVTILPAGQGAPPPLPFPIVYEDSDLLAIEKPAGLLSVASDKERDRTAFRMVSDTLAAIQPDSRIWVVHRLDRDTSGLLLFAKNLETREKLQSEWEKLVYQRGYLAVVQGHPDVTEGRLRCHLKETKTHLVYPVSTPLGGGKEAVTRFRVVKSNGTYSLLELFLETGRKNQIRVQLQDIGCPVVGDRQYGGPKSPIGRLCLHAHKLSFIHPRTGEKVELKSRKPRDFNRLFREEKQ